MTIISNHMLHPQLLYARIFLFSIFRMSNRPYVTEKELLEKLERESSSMY